MPSHSGRQKRNTVAIVSSPKTANSHHAWEKRLRHWCDQHKIPDGHVRLVEATLPHPSQWRLSLLLQGLEVVVEEGMDAIEEQAGEERDRYPKLVSAKASCPWECVQRRVARAEAATLGAPVEFFLEELLVPEGVEAATTQHASDRREHRDSLEELNELEHLESFAGWLNENSGLVRVDATAANMAWDFPLSKDEKRERLVMFLCHENDSQWR
eukprot:4246351-Amphidinium_carterae.1